jgi:AhpD family alkylhydroperoxidase
VEKHVMDKNYSDICTQIFGTQRHSCWRGPQPALDTATKELIVLALGLNARCDGCVGFHAEDLVKLGATRKESSRYGRLHEWRSVTNLCADALGAFELAVGGRALCTAWPRSD